MSEIPQGWEKTDLGTLLDGFQYGLTAKADKSSAGTRFVRITDIENYQVNWANVPAVSDHLEEDKYRLKHGDFIFARSGSVEKVCRVENPPDAVFASYLIRGRPILEDVSDWLVWYVRSNEYLEQVFERASGIGMSNVNAQKFATIKVPLPPLAEQRRIAAKLDSLFARTRRAREELSKIPQLIEHYKQAILSAAYKEAGAKVLPLEEIATEVRNGFPQKPENSPPGTPILRISALRPGSVNLEDTRFCRNSLSEIKQYYLKDEDLLFTRYNGNADLVASCGRVKGLKQQIIIYPDKLIRVKIDTKQAESSFVEIMAQAPESRTNLYPFIKTAAGQHGISGKDLKALPIPLPDLQRQRIIVERVEEALKSIEKIARETQKALLLIDSLDEANLAKAFRGELVPQDPNDEPASILLERISAERETKPATKRKQRNTDMVEERTGA